MSLPSAEELSRWTVSRVTDWLTESSLAVFRQEFLIDHVDGNKLLRLTAQDIDLKYKHINKKKRDVLKMHVSKIENSRHLPSWTPQLPPRAAPGDRGRIPAPVPAPVPVEDNDDDDDDGWGTEFDDDDMDYLEPTTRPPPSAAPGHSQNGQHRPSQDHGEPPQSEYEIDPLADDVDNLSMQPRSELGRSETIIDRLRNQLAQRNVNSVTGKGQSRVPVADVESDSDSDDQSYIEPVSVVCHDAPPRPPRGGLTNTNSQSPQSSPAISNRPPPPPPDTRRNEAQPEDVYEIMNDLEDAGPDEQYTVPDTVPTENRYLDLSDTCKCQRLTTAISSVEMVTTRKTRIHEDGTVRKGHNAPAHKRDLPKAEPSLPPRPARRQVAETKEPAVSNEEDLSTYPWYHGKIDRNYATVIFEREQKNGMFLIRKSERDPKQPYTLVIWDSNRIWNLPIRRLENKLYAPGKFKPGETQFKSIVELVEHFKVTPLNLKSGGSYAEGSNYLTMAAPKR